MNLRFLFLFCLKKFKLLGGFRVFFAFFSPKYFHHSKLFIGDRENANMAFGREYGLYSFDVDFCIFLAAAMPDVHTELKHAKTVGDHFFPELGVVFPVFFRFCRQVKMY